MTLLLLFPWCSKRNRLVRHNQLPLNRLIIGVLLMVLGRERVSFGGYIFLAAYGTAIKSRIWCAGAGAMKRIERIGRILLEEFQIFVLSHARQRSCLHTGAARSSCTSINLWKTKLTHYQQIPGASSSPRTPIDNE
jgi:hypothetical protein